MTTHLRNGRNPTEHLDRPIVAAKKDAAPKQMHINLPAHNDQDHLLVQRSRRDNSNTKTDSRSAQSSPLASKRSSQERISRLSRKYGGQQSHADQFELRLDNHILVQQEEPRSTEYTHRSNTASVIQHAGDK